jgi:cysteine desulfuration protein SufE
MESIEERQRAIEAEFTAFDDWTDKYELIIDWGKEIPGIPEERRSDDWLIRGCQSRVWMIASRNPDGTVHLEADSDAIITKGLAGMMVRIFDGLPPAEVAQAPLWVLDRVGLSSHLSPTRANGLRSMVDQIRRYGQALALQA